jgi:hypothetical protein
MLESNSVDAAAKLFAATTLKGKVYPHPVLQPPMLMRPDCVRPPPSASRVTPEPARLDHEKCGHLPCWAQAYQTTTLRMPGESGYSDDRMEGRAVSHRLHAWGKPFHSTLRLRLPPRPPGRSHTWTKNQPHSTFGRVTIHHQLTGTSMRYRQVVSGSESNTSCC